jgi:hypothetical protein
MDKIMSSENLVVEQNNNSESELEQSVVDESDYESNEDAI